MKPVRVAVVFGGRSAEHEISVESAKTVIANLDPKRYEVLPLRIDRDGRWQALPGRLALTTTAIAARPAAPQALLSNVDVVFPVLHGPMGEDGTVQGLFELAGRPYVGCGVLASAVGMDKDVSSRLAVQAGLPVPPHVLLRDPKDLKIQASAVRALGLPLFVKPCNLGSSVGIRKVKKASELPSAVKNAFRFDTKVLVEKGINDAQEICIAALGEPGAVDTSVCGEIEVTGKHDFFDYEAKYFDDAGHALYIPARLTKDEARRLSDLAKLAFTTFEGFGMARVDFFVERKSRRMFFGEINTIPGFTSHSLYPKLWDASGLPLPRLLDRLIALSLARHSRRSRLVNKP